MNHVYRLVWSKVRNMLVAVAETAGSHSKGGTPRAPRHLRALLALLLILGAPLAAAQVPLGQGQLVVAAPVQAALAPVRTALVSVQRVDPGVSTPTVVAPLPTAGHVVAGQATLSQSGNTLTIAQSTSKAVLNWQSFDIGAGYTVNFEQPNASSVALNRVLGSNPSAIFGHLNANGQVFLTNANGVFFAPGAEVHVGGLVASTLGISNTDFLSGNYHFSGTSTAGVHNAGAMTAAQGGYVAFIGNTVDNTGTVRTPGGTTALGAGAGVDITLAGDQLVNFRVSDAALHALAANGGVIQADGGRVILSAQGRNAVLQTVVNNSGQIRAQTLENHDGKIELLGGDSGTVQVAGTLDASAPQGGNGGQIETSGASVKIADGTVITTKSSTGNSGNWLIDPTDFTIAASGGDMSGATLSTALGSGGVTIQSTAGGSGVHGDVNVNDTVTWSANTLTLNAYRDININTAMNGSGTAGLALQYGQGSTNGVIGGTAATYNVNAPVNLANGGSFSTQLGTNVGNLVSYTILTSLGAESSTTGTDLQGISGDLAGNYVLGSNIDALPTSGWNGGAGFAPIGSNNFNAYTGIFDGLGHTISDLTIARSGTDNVGLFGYVNGGTLRNLGLVGGSVSGYNKVGGLVGFNSNGGTITDAYVTGSVSVSVSGHYYVGGLVGFNNNGTITDAYVTSSSSVSVSGSLNVGGLVGYNGGTLSDAYATGRVSGSGGNVGGLVGFNSNGTISDAYATGSVSGSGRNVGGLIGQIGNGNISNVYATGRVSGSSGHVGGLVGSNSNGTINNAYWDSYSTGQAAALGAGSNFAATAITSDPTKSSNSNYAFKQSAYANFNFTTGTGTGTWFMVDGSTRPFLASEYSTTISNTHQLQLVAMDLGASYTLASNLDASETARAVNSSVAADASGMWSKAGFVPIGTNGNGFTGVFDGLGHTVSNLTINRPSTDFVGLFGHVNGGTLRDIGLVSDSITGNDRVGGLVGNNSNGSISDAYATGSVSGGGHVGGLIGFNYGGTISGAYTTGDVSGGDEYVGGLIGFNFGGTINNTYTSGSVSGTRYVGGLLGSNYQGMINNAYTSGSVNGSSFRIGGLVGYNVEGTIENAYTTGNVSGSANVGGLAGGNNAGTISNAYATGSATGNNSVVGRLVGSNSNGAIINNAYWDTTTSASGATVGIGYDNLGSISGGGGLTTAALAAALPTGFASGVWGNGDNQTTPYLLSHASFGTVSGSAILGTDSSATPTHYGVILTLDQLQNINSTGLSSDYVLGGNIDASATSGWNSGAGFAPIGNSNNAFNGVFDGLGHTVSGLIINRPSTDDVGLFGHVNGGTLRNIGLVDGSVSGKNFVGGLVGIIFTGTISDSYTTGSVSGDSVVGGLAGNTSNTTIHDSHTTGSVSGGAATGGLVGHNSNGSIGNVYATGSVSGSSNVGGLIGEHFYGTISDAYATGNVSSSAGNNIGGLVGYNGPGPINNAYATGSVSGNGNVGGLVG
ncbi:MAG: GLUG motif-containing protein, partial [Rhodanobacter sp.]